MWKKFSGTNINITVGEQNIWEPLLEVPLHEKCLYSELFCSVFSCIGTECGEILLISQYSVWMREDTDQKNSKYRHFYTVCDLQRRLHQILNIETQEKQQKT